MPLFWRRGDQRDEKVAVAVGGGAAAALGGGGMIVSAPAPAGLPTAASPAAATKAAEVERPGQEAPV
jgi:hypothetical protein